MCRGETQIVCRNIINENQNKNISFFEKKYTKRKKFGDRQLECHTQILTLRNKILRKIYIGQGHLKEMTSKCHLESTNARKKGIKNGSIWKPRAIQISKNVTAPFHQQIANEWEIQTRILENTIDNIGNVGMHTTWLRHSMHTVQ